MKEYLNFRSGWLLVLILAAISIRFITESHFPFLFNFSPLAAIALFAGVHFKNRIQGIVVTLGVLLISDLIINVVLLKGQYGIMYTGWYWVYGAFIMVVLMGEWVLKKFSFSRFVVSAVVASLLHWTVTNFGVWLGLCTDVTTGLPYSLDMTGFVRCYTLALPFLKNLLLGTLFYGAFLFGIFEWVKAKNPRLVAN